jgi:hypothetical protein
VRLLAERLHRLLTGPLRLERAPLGVLQDRLRLSLRIVTPDGDLLGEQMRPLGDAVLVDWLSHVPRLAVGRAYAAELVQAGH